MWKSSRFWLILAVILFVPGLFFLPSSPIRFGGYFLCGLGVCCAGEGWMVWLGRRHRGAHVVAQVGRVLFALFCVSFVCIQGLIISGEHADPEADEAQYVLVLGAHILQDRPSDALIERLKTADEFLDEHPDAIAILCGGQGTNEPMPESHMMRQYMVDTLGTDPDRLLIEDKSRNTIQNIANAKALYPLEESRCAVISSDFHLARARILMEQAGLDPYGVPAPVPNLPLAAASHMREYCSTLGLILTGRYF